jgi:hypothetical protein
MSNAKGKYLATVIAIAMILLSVTTAPAQRRSGEAPKQSGKPRVVVIGTGSGDTSWTSNITTATLEDALSQGGKFELITAAQRDKILSEQGFNNSDLVDPKQATRVGKLLSARFIIVGNALDVSLSKTKLGGVSSSLGGVIGRRAPSGDLSADVKSKVQIQMIDAETGVLKLSRSYEEKTSKDTLTKSRSETDIRQEGYRKAMEKIASQFSQEVGTSVPVGGLVVFVRGGRVAIDLGSDQSIQVGQEFEVYTEDEPIKNAAGEVLSYVTTKHARLRIASVEPKLAWATVVETYNENGTPDPQPKLDRIQVNYAVKQIK